MDYLAPLSDDLLRMSIRGLRLSDHPRVVDLCCGTGAASRLLAKEFGAVCTGVDADERLLRWGRQALLDAELAERVSLVQGDARHVELPAFSYDLVLALGGTLTYVGRSEGLERIRHLLVPGGALLLSDLVYLDSEPPHAARRFLQEKAPENKIRPLSLEPAVRAVFEEGFYRYETEESYRALLAAHGYELEFAFLVPESAWNAYYGAAASGNLAPGAIPESPVGADELAAFYAWGGRWGVAYLVCGARIASE